jgi:hypothetical protein
MKDDTTASNETVCWKVPIGMCFRVGGVLYLRIETSSIKSPMDYVYGVALVTGEVTDFCEHDFCTPVPDARVVNE